MDPPSDFDRDSNTIEVFVASSASMSSRRSAAVNSLRLRLLVAAVQRAMARLSVGRRAAGPRGNARKPHGQRLQMGAGRVAVTSRCDDGRLTMTIEDDGPGLCAAQHGGALAPGARFDENVPGTGLGARDRA